MNKRRWQWNQSVWTRTQAILLWTVGFAGVINELFVQETPRPYAYPILGALIGGPFAIEFDRQRRSASQPPTGRPSLTQSEGEARG